MDSVAKIARPQVKKWNIIETPDAQLCLKLATELGVELPIAKMLIQRGITDFEAARSFFRPSIEHLHDPMLMLDMDKAVERTRKAIENQEGILVYGDYDVDGTTAVALMYSFLQTIHQGLLAYYIPDRYTEGYGVSFQGIDHAAEKGISLIIALDCGIRSVDKVNYALDKGIDFIICDHHIPGETIPNAYAVLDPKRNDCPYPFKELSGCGIGFKLIQALIANGLSAQDPSVYLDLVALSVAADIVPITGENRVLAYFGLQRINKQAREGIQVLLKSSKEKAQTKDITITDLVFSVAPKINAAGRIEHGSRSVEMLITNDRKEAEEIGVLINQTNMRRCDIDTKMTAEAFALIEADQYFAANKSTVLFQAHWHKGVVGIVASRVLEKYYKPTIILTQNDGIVTGSARSIRNFDIHAALSRCADLLIQFGGHAFAAGMSLKPENLDAFIARFESVAQQQLREEDLQEVIDIDLEISPEEISPKFYRVLKQFAPFGPGNMAPVFLSKGLRDDGAVRIVGNNHLKLRLGKRGQPCFDAIAFGKSEYYTEFSEGLPCDVCYTLDENHWNGRISLQLNIRDIRI